MSQSANNQKSMFGGGQSELDMISNILTQYNQAIEKLPQVQTVQDIMGVTNAISKLIQKNQAMNTDTLIVKSK